MSDKYEELEKLQSLKEREIISEEEFQREKEKILNAPEKKKTEFDLKKIGINIKNKKRFFIIIAVVLVLISIICNIFHDVNWEKANEISKREVSVFKEKVKMERSNYYDEDEYERLCEKEEELSKEYIEYINKASMFMNIFYVCLYLTLFICLLYAIFTLKGNNLSKKEFFVKLIKIMVIPVVIIITLMLMLG